MHVFEIFQPIKIEIIKLYANPKIQIMHGEKDYLFINEKYRYIKLH